MFQLWCLKVQVHIWRCLNVPFLKVAEWTLHALRYLPNIRYLYAVFRYSYSVFVIWYLLFIFMRYSKFFLSNKSFCAVKHRFSKCSVRSPMAPLEKPRGSVSIHLLFCFYFRNLLWSSVNNGHPLQVLRNAKSLRIPAVKNNESKAITCFVRNKKIHSKNKITSFNCFDCYVIIGHLPSYSPGRSNQS